MKKNFKFVWSKQRQKGIRRKNQFTNWTRTNLTAKRIRRSMIWQVRSFTRAHTHTQTIWFLDSLLPLATVGPEDKRTRNSLESGSEVDREWRKALSRLLVCVCVRAMMMVVVAMMVLASCYRPVMKDRNLMLVRSMDFHFDARTQRESICVCTWWKTIGFICLQHIVPDWNKENDWMKDKQLVKGR